MAIGRTNAGGGGGSGATLTITGVAGATVTASKDGKTYTRTINSSGTAVFKGLSTGTWTVTMSSNGQTTTRTVEITADYSLAIAFFSATISITYPAASTCVVTDSTGATVASDTNADSAAKTWTVTVGATGTYTITATSTSGGKTKSTTVSIAADGQSKSVTLAYDYIIFSNATGLNSVYSDGGGGAPVEIGKDSSGKKTLTFTADGYSRMSYLKPAIDLTNYSILKISGYCDGGNAYLAFWSKVPLEYDPSVVAQVTLSNGSSPSSYTIDISKLSGSYYLGAQYAVANIVTYDLRLE